MPLDSNQVRPVNTSACFDSSTFVMAVEAPSPPGPGTIGVAGPFCQPAIVPFFVAKMNNAGALGARAKSAVPLKIIPVGVEGVVTPAAFRMVTTRGTVTPAPVYRVAVPVAPLFDHQGVDAPRAIPHGFFRCGSIPTVVPSALGG